MTADYTQLSRNLNRHADKVDALANLVEEWGEVGNRSAHKALGLIETAQQLVTDAERFYGSSLIGPNTKASFRNDASIALGMTNGASARGRGDLGYALMHAMYSMEQYGADTALANMKTKASGLRVHAASCRVIAGIADGIVEGRYRSIG